LHAPFATPRFTLRLQGRVSQPPALRSSGSVISLEKVGQKLWLKNGTWCEDDGGVLLCFDLPKGQTTVAL
jgi:hypothetical protein